MQKSVTANTTLEPAMKTAELVKPRTAVETLTAMGLTQQEAKGFLNRIENSFTGQTSKLIRYKQQKTHVKHKRALMVVWAYAFIVWLYVIAMQLQYPNSVYWPFAVWIPIRMDYLGEMAFISSFILAIALTLWNTKLTPESPKGTLHTLHD